MNLMLLSLDKDTALMVVKLITTGYPLPVITNLLPLHKTPTHLIVRLNQAWICCRQAQT